MSGAIQVAARLAPIRLMWILDEQGFLGFLPRAISGDWAVARVARKQRPVGAPFGSIFMQRWEWWALTDRSEVVGHGVSALHRSAVRAVEIKLTELGQARE